jgi:hypothetical protein
MSLLEDNEMVVYQDKNGQILSAGYSIESELLKQKESPLLTLNNKQNGGHIGHLMKDLAVPAGLFLLKHEYNNILGDTKTNYTEPESIDDDQVIEDTLYNKLIQLSEYKPKKKETRKVRKRKQNSTKRK